MGKRKLHGCEHYQCDYTGFPIRRTPCHLQYYNEQTKKVTKRNHYYNWEAALAHARLLRTNNSLTQLEFEDAVCHIVKKTSDVVPGRAPSIDELKHLCEGGEICSLAEFHRECCISPYVVQVLQITQAGELLEKTLEIRNNHLPLKSIMAPLGRNNPVFFLPRRKNGFKSKQLQAWHIEPHDSACAPNAKATTLFKESFYGDLVLVQRSEEDSEIYRVRYSSYTLDMFYAEFKCKSTESPRNFDEVNCALTGGVLPEEYTKIKEDMESTLRQFEQKASAKAQLVSARKPRSRRVGAELAKHARTLQSLSAASSARATYDSDQETGAAPGGSSARSDDESESDSA